ncbi:MAG: purine-nucleoside phosphorylase [Acidobacteriota bacterium]
MSAKPASEYPRQLRAARDFLAAQAAPTPRMLLILGSGLGAFEETLSEPTTIPYQEVPHWPISTVEGHAGKLVLGLHGGLPVAVMQGRVHLYEGYSAEEVAFPTRALAMLGCRALLVSNAAGAINPEFEAGELMLIRDHLNLQGVNPCTGSNLAELGPRFFDMSHAYHPAYQELALEAASSCGIVLRQGVYAGLPGPSYETPAEIHMLSVLGADAVGMSTVPEVIAASHAGMRVVGISCLTNMAAGATDRPLDHDEVMQTAARVRGEFVALIDELLGRIALAEGWNREAEA